jgi:hypothetical protein
MRYFNRAAICLTVLLSTLRGFSSAETLYRPDSSKVEFTMGCCFSTYLFHPDDSSLTPEITFEPLFSIPGIETTKVIYSGLNDSGFVVPPDGYPYYLPFKNDFIAKYLKDKVGDSVLIIGNKETILGEIIEIGVYCDNLSDRPICRFKPLKPDAKDNSFENNHIIALRNQSSYSGPIYHYNKYELVDSAEQKLADTLKEIVASYWATNANISNKSLENDMITDIYGDSSRKSISCYKRIDGPETDTMFWVTYFYEISDSPIYMIYLIFKSQGIYKYQSLMPYGQYINSINVIMATDINNDGQLEFLLHLWDEYTDYDELYQLDGDQFKFIVYGCREGH